MENREQVIYAPHILRSMGEICEAMGVSQKTVRTWAEQGAPIAVEGQGRKTRYSAEAARLQFWRERFGNGLQADTGKGTMRASSSRLSHSTTDRS